MHASGSSYRWVEGVDAWPIAAEVDVFVLQKNFVAQCVQYTSENILLPPFQIISHSKNLRESKHF